MRRMRDCLVVFVALARFCSLTASATEEPKSAIVGILSLFPGYHVLTLADRDAETRAFIRRHFPKDDPSVVHADIDGDGHLDYALLLRDDKSSHAKLAVLLCSADRSCKKVYESDVTGYSDEAYLRPASGGSPVTGIRVTYLGKGEVVYSWNRKHKKIEAVQTAD